MTISRVNIVDLVPYFEKSNTILVPSLRIKDAILAEYHGQNPGTYLSPLVVPIDVWVKELWELLGASGIQPFCHWQQLSGNEERFVWSSITKDSRTNSPLLNPEETAKQISQSYQDAQQWQIWSLLNEETSHYKANPDVSAFIHWSQSFQRYCADKKLISLVDSIKLLTEEISSDVSALLPKNIVLCNFDQPPPLYSAFFDALSSLCPVHRIKQAISQPSSQKSGNAPKIIRYEFSESKDEIVHCARWAHALCEADKEAHVGIILTSPSIDKSVIERELDNEFRPEIAIEFEQSEPLFNANSYGRPISDDGFIKDALTYLQLFWAEQKSTDVCKLLQSDYIVGAEEERFPRIQAELKLRERHGPNCALYELSVVVGNPEFTTHCSLLSSALLEAKSLIRASSSLCGPRAWARLFQDLLQIVNWPGESLSKEQQRSLSAWEELLKQFSTFEKSLGLLDAESAIRKLRTLLDNTTLGTGFSPRKQLSVYTAEEAQGLRFDHVWLLGFDDQNWPLAASPSAFLPYDLQRSRGMPGAHGESQYQMALDNLERLQQSVQSTITASHHASEGDQQKRVSSLLAHFALQENQKSEKWTLNNFSRSLYGDNVTEQIADDSTPALQASEIIRGGQSVLSNQSACPFRAFARHRLRTNELDDFSNGLSSLARGIALHIVMENFYKGLSNQAELNALSHDELNTRLLGAVDRSIHYLNSNYTKIMTPRFTEIESARLLSLATQFIEVDKNRAEFSLVEQEKSYTWAHESLELSLTIDRIDRLEDNSLALIDYKTGKNAPRRDSWLQERPEDLQLPLYFVTAQSAEQSPISALAIAHVNAEKMEYSGLCANSNFDKNLNSINHDEKITETWEELTELWRVRVENVAKEFTEGRADVDPINDRSTCQYCGLQSLCRIQELRLKQNDLDLSESDGELGS